MRISQVAVSAALVVVSSLSAALADTIELKIAAAAPEGSPWAQLLSLYEARVEKASKGRIDVTIEHRATGTEPELVAQTSRGGLQGMLASGGAVGTVVAELETLELPFLFRSAAEVDRVLDGALMAPMEKRFREHGLVLGFWNENGFRHIGSTFPIHKPRDLSGKTIRSVETPIHVEMWRALKVDAQTTPADKVVSKLQSSELDGFDQTLLFAVASEWHTAVKHVTLTSHIYQPAVVAFNQTWFDGLPKDLQKIVLGEGRKLSREGRAIVRRVEPGLLKTLRKAGVKVTRLSAAERSAFEAATAAVRSGFRKNYSPTAIEMLDKIEKALGRKIR
ncbi:MAG: TRAP transporter substrate-binding protein [Kofleriaceae bacterium]